METVSNGLIKDIIRFGVQNNASDVHFSSGQQPVLRIMGEFKRVDIPAVPHRELSGALLELLNKNLKQRYETCHEVDLAFSMDDTARVRGNIYDHFYGIAGAFRLFPQQIRSLDDLMMPQVIKQLVSRKKGMILVTGPAGSGKSTTLAAMLHEINQQRRDHIITVEDPVEYIHQPLQCMIHQREVRIHTESYAKAIMNALREDPDVILLGEMRDMETIQYALQAAETGQLVLSTLHTNSAAESIDRMVDVFPAAQQQQIRAILANTLIGVIAQRLVPMAFKNDRTALMEIMIATTAVKNLIREGKTYQIDSAIQTGAERGMLTFEKSFEKMRRNNLISPQLQLSDIV
ncbi:MAG: PilT/PilU family type 4a pilus ATPase [Calditrichia bacterium]